MARLAKRALYGSTVSWAQHIVQHSMEEVQYDTAVRIVGGRSSSRTYLATVVVI